MTSTSWDEFLEAVDETESETQLPNCSFLGAADLNNIKGDKLVGLNIRGLKSNHASLADFFDGLNRPQDVKILTLTEIFNADSSEKDNYIPTHNFISSIRKERISN